MLEIIPLHRPRISAQTETARAKVQRQRPRNGAAHSLLATTTSHIHNHTTQPRRILSSTYLSISYKLRITAHKYLQDQLSDSLRKQRVPSKSTLALRHNSSQHGIHLHLRHAHLLLPPQRLRERHSAVPKLRQLQRTSLQALGVVHVLFHSWYVHSIQLLRGANKQTQEANEFFSPVIPFSLKPDKDVGCHICKFYQDLRHRPDVQNMMEGGGGGQQIPMQGGPQGWNQQHPQQPQYAQGGQPQYK